MTRAARTNGGAPDVVVAAADGGERLIGTAAEMLEAKKTREDLSERPGLSLAIAPELSRRMWQRAEA